MDLPGWLSLDNTRSSIILQPLNSTVMLMTDASLNGWGTSLSVASNHIPGKQNVLVYSLLRRSPVQVEGALGQSVFQAMGAQFGLAPVVDLLATPLNSQLSVFISPFLYPAMFCVDTL